MKPKDCTCTGVCLQIPDGSCQRLNKSMDSGNDKVPQFISSEPKADPKEQSLIKFFGVSGVEYIGPEPENIHSILAKLEKEYPGHKWVLVNENANGPITDGEDEWTKSGKSYRDKAIAQFKKDFGPKETFIETEVELCSCEVKRACGIAVMCFMCEGKQKYIKIVSFKLKSL